MENKNLDISKKIAFALLYVFHIKKLANNTILISDLAVQFIKDLNNVTAPMGYSAEFECAAKNAMSVKIFPSNSRWN